MSAFVFRRMWVFLKSKAEGGFVSGSFSSLCSSAFVKEFHFIFIFIEFVIGCEMKKSFFSLYCILCCRLVLLCDLSIQRFVGWFKKQVFFSEIFFCRNVFIFYSIFFFLVRAQISILNIVFDARRVWSSIFLSLNANLNFKMENNDVLREYRSNIGRRCEIKTFMYYWLHCLSPLLYQSKRIKKWK